MSTIQIDKMNIEPNFKFGHSYLEIKGLLKQFLEHCTETKYGLNHAVFQGLTEAFFTKDHILQNLNDKEVLIKNYLYFWPDPKSTNELKSIVQNYLEWRARYITLIEDYENRKKMISLRSLSETMRPQR